MDDFPHLMAEKKGIADAHKTATTLPRTATDAGPDLPVVIAAWLSLEPETAARLLEEWLASASSGEELKPFCPIVCQLAENIAASLPNASEWVRCLLPVVGRYVENLFDHYDPQGRGLPRWPSAEEALFPAEFVPGQFTVDLAVLLANEAAAFCRLAAGCPEWDRLAGLAEGEQRELDDWLANHLWDEEASAFHRLPPGKPSEPDLSPTGFFPLLWPGATDNMVISLRGRIDEWRPDRTPARTWVLFFALVLPTPHTSVVAWMQRTGLPPDASAAVAEAWKVLNQSVDRLRAHYIHQIPPPARWLAFHGRPIARALLVAGLGLLAALLIWHFRFREGSGWMDAASWERQAREACAQGQHERAAALYSRAARNNRKAYFLYRSGNEWMHAQQYGAAETAYRAALAREPDAPSARMNLALALLHQGRTREALEIYRALSGEESAQQYPEITARARLAAELIQRQLALDRP